MKRFFLVSASVLAFAMAVPVASQYAAAPITPAAPVSGHVVQKGENLWKLAELKFGDPEKWHYILEQNPYLKEKGRQFTKPDGTFVVVIKEGELLRGLSEVGIKPTSMVGPVATPTAHAAETQIVEKTFSEKVVGFLTDWWWLLPLLLVVGFLGWLLAQLNKDPVRSGSAQVPGGVSDGTIHDHLKRRARAWNYDLIPGTIVRGRGYGLMWVAYQGNVWEALRLRRLTGQVVYRARAWDRYGQEVDVYTLQECGNDISSLRRFRLFNNFRFEREVEVVEPVVVPVPEAVVEAVVAPAPEPISPTVAAVAPAAAEVPEVARTHADEFLLKYTAARTPGGTHCIELGANPPSGFSLSLGTTGSAVIKWRSKAK